MKKIIVSSMLIAGLMPHAQGESIKQSLEQQIEKIAQRKISEKEAKALSEGIFFETSTTSKNLAADVSKLRDDKNTKTIRNEQLLSALESGLFYDLSVALKEKNLQEINSIFDKNGVTATSLASLSGEKREVDGIKWTRSRPSENPIKLSVKEIKQELKNYLSDFNEIAFSEMKVLRITGMKALDRRISHSSDSLNIEIEAALDLRGFDKNDLPTQKRSTQRFNLARKDLKSAWVITGMRTIEHTHLVQTRKPAFQRFAANSGFDKGKVYPRLEALRRGGYAFAVEDFNNDGQLDAFVGNFGESTLWLGKKDGTFSEVKSDVNKVTLAKAAAFIDVNNDGMKDLLITRFSNDTFTGDVLLFKNQGGQFKVVENAFPSKILREYAMPMAVADYNNDGLLDVYIGFPGEKDFSMSTYDVEGNNDRKNVNGLFINQGNYTFKDRTLAGIPKSIQNKIYPHGAVASDFNGDNKMDIVVMDDQMNLSPILKNVGEGDFALVNQDLRITNRGYGMGVATGDIDNDGKMDILMSNATFNSQRRIGLSSPRDKANEEINGATSGLRFFKNTGRSLFQDQTIVAGLMDAGEGAGGVTLIDYDNDGLLDIYLVNGLWSGSSARHKIDSLFAIAQDQKITKLDHFLDGMGERKRGETQSSYMKILMSERVQENGKEASLSFGGHQANRLFKNLGNGEFLEVGHLEGISSMSDGYMSLVADINQDGRPDLMLRNCDPGSELAPFPVIETFQNNHPNKNSLWLSFKGLKSNKMGVGVKVQAQVDGKTIIREVQANNSAIQGEVMAHIGLGDAEKADKLIITWPSGLSDTLTNVKAGRHLVSEGGESVAAR